MKREFLKGITFKVGEQDVTLTDEIIEKIMKENGADIEGTKTKLNGQIENLNSELKTTKETLDQANVQIENFKGMDVEGTKKAAEEWKTKYETFEANSKTEKETYEQKLKDQEYEFAVKEFANQHKFTSDFTKNAFVEDFKKQGLKLNEGKFLGAEDYIKQFQEKNQGVFAVEEAPKEENNAPGIVDFTAPTGGQNKQENKNNFGFNFNYLQPKEK